MCSDCVPPLTAANACSATRTMLLTGCCAVSVTPPVCVWKRIIIAFGFVAPKRSRIVSAQIRRAARNLATSWKTLLWPLKKNASRGANASTSSPASIAACTYAIPLASVNATSCTAEQPFSRKW